MACHSDSKKKYFSTLNNIFCIENYIQDLIIINSSEAKYSNHLKDDLKDYKKIKSYHTIPNDNHYDFGKWVYALSNHDVSDYDFILFINDSILIMNNIVNYFYFFDNISEKVNLYAYNDSTQNNIYHYQSYLFLMNVNIIDNFFKLFKSKKEKIINKESLIEHMEMNLINLDEKHDVFLKLGKEWNTKKNIFWENEELYEYLLNKNIFHLFKFQKIDDSYEFCKINYQHEINNFDSTFYLNQYQDLKNKNFNNNQLIKHYKEYGFKEGRKSNKNHYYIISNYYDTFLKKKNLNSFFCLDNNFDIVQYKKKNTSIKHLSNEKTILHFYKYGIENDENYNEQMIINKNKNYLYFIDKIFNKKIKLPNDFNLTEFIKLNSHDIFFKNKGLLNTILFLNENNIKIYNYIQIKSELNIDYFKKIFKEYKDLSKEEIEILFYKFYKNITFKKIPENQLKLYAHKNNIIYDKNKIYSYYFHKNKSQLKENNIFINITMKNDIKSDMKSDIKSDIKSDMKSVMKSNIKSNIKSDFDPKIYKILNKDIQDFSDKDAEEHYYQNGIHENRLYKIPDDFSSIAYKYHYFDEFKHFNDEQLNHHFLHNGYHEKRNYKLPYYFHPDVYKKIVPSLEKMNNNNLIEHFMKFDYKKDKLKKSFNNFYENPENEKIFNSLNLIPNNFNENIYKILYDDLKKLNSLQLKNHYLNQGMHEQRKYNLPDDFDIKLYKYFNTDLENLNNNELIRHYIFIGIKEKRIYKIPENFDEKIYKKLNKDLNNLTDNQLRDHFMNSGFREKRAYYIPDDFDCQEYKRLYIDLKNLNNDELISHYANKGIYEKRIYKIPNDFDENEYKKFYDDLKNLSNEEAIYHYVTNGIKEKRLYKVPEDFNIKRYKQLHFDLQFMNDVSVYEHFINHGIQENRQYSGFNKYFKEITKKVLQNNNEIQNNISKNVKNNKNNENDKNDKNVKNDKDQFNLNKLPSDFSVKGYKLFNPDLIYFDKDEYLKKHYLEIGIHEKRLYKIPYNFNHDLYKRLNPDLDLHNKNDLINHFKSNGSFEKRNYLFPNDFDYEFYKNIYLDKNKNYSKHDIQEHYLNVGIHKKYRINSPNDFNVSIFKKLNIDLEKINNYTLIKNFIEGEYKNRIYK